MSTQPGSEHQPVAVDLPATGRRLPGRGQLDDPSGLHGHIAGPGRRLPGPVHDECAPDHQIVHVSFPFERTTTGATLRRDERCRGMTPPRRGRSLASSVMRSPVAPFRRWTRWPVAVVGLALFLVPIGCSSGSSAGPASSNASDASAAEGRSGSAPDHASDDSAVTSAAASTTSASSTTTPGATGPATAPPAPAPAPVAPSPTVTEGDHRVGADLNPGRYLSRSVDCSWARLRIAADGSTTVIASGTSSGQTIVDVLPTDGGFTSSRCGTWIPYQPDAGPVTTFGDGTWAVGGQIAPGSYRPSAADGCDWARLRDFQGVAGSSIASGSVDSSGSVVIQPTDAGFSSTGCGTWTPA